MSDVDQAESLPDGRLSPAVLAEDLRALADGPFDVATVTMLNQAADWLDGHHPDAPNEMGCSRHAR